MPKFSDGANRSDFSSLPTISSSNSTKSRSSKTSGSSKSSNSSKDGEKGFYYYYVYRKKIDPSEIKSLDDLPIPLIFRRNNIKFENKNQLTGSLVDLATRKNDVGNGRNLSPIKTPSIPKSSKNKRHLERSNSLPEIERKSPKQLTRNHKLKPIQRNVENSTTKPLPRIHNENNKRPSSTRLSTPDEGELKKGLSVPFLLNLIPMDGMEWSRHTTMVKTPNGVAEKTINIETRKTKKDGKWVEETVKTTSLTDEAGTEKKSQKNFFRKLNPEEIGIFENARFERPISAPSSTASIDTTKKDFSREKSSSRALKPIRKSPVTRILINDENKEEDDNFQEDFAKEVLEKINEYRNLHGVKNLTLNLKLTKIAKEWVEKLATTERMEHNAKKGLGENIYCKTSSQAWFPMSGTEVVENWYSEVEEHSYNEEPKPGYLKTGHFTQLIWTDTREMGVAYDRNKNGHMAFVVSYYFPKGNWYGEFKLKVPPPGGFSANKMNRRISKSSKNKTSASSEDLKNFQINSENCITKSRSKRQPTKSESEILEPLNQTFTLTPLHKDLPKNTRITNYKRNSPSSTSYFSRNTVSKTSRTMTGDFKKDFLQAHNDYRKLHGAKPLRYSNKLNIVAQNWADRLAKLDILEHKDNSEYGENLYVKILSNAKDRLAGFEPVAKWYSEIEDYEFGKEPIDIRAGHFTQVVWAETTTLGVGIANSDTGRIYVVGNYDPAGNYVGDFTKNVLPPK